MSDTPMVPANPMADRRPGGRRIDEQLADQLLGKAAADGVELLGPDDLPSP
jgi:hypothetical protein